MQGKDRLASLGELHRIGLPMTGNRAIKRRALRDRDALLNAKGGAAALTAAEASLGLAAGQVVTPAVVLGTDDLGKDEAVDGLVADDLFALLERETPRDGLRGQALGEQR